MMKIFNHKMQELTESSAENLLGELAECGLYLHQISTPLYEDGEYEIVAYKLKSEEEILKLINEDVEQDE